jgi:hypothetical protein
MNESQEFQRVEVCTITGRDAKAGTLRLYILRQVTDEAGALLEERGEFLLTYDEPADAKTQPRISMQPPVSQAPAKS